MLTLCMAMPAPPQPAFTQDSMDRMTGILTTPSTSGDEDAIQKLWLQHVAPLADSSGTDADKNAWATFNSPLPGAPSILIDAHVDEVGLIIKKITPSGFLKVGIVGFPDLNALRSSPYLFNGEKGPVKAFAGSKPGWWKTSPADPLFIDPGELLFDAGASSEQEAREMGLKPGQRGTPATKPELLHGSRLMAHGLDCRINSFILTELAHFLSNHRKDLQYNVTLLSSSKEEIGLVGATAYCLKHRPALAIVIDCTVDTAALDDQPDEESEFPLSRQVMGKGPVIFTHKGVFHMPITDHLLQLARQNAIPVQQDATFPAGLANFCPVKFCGGQAAFMGPAIRYMHSPRELVDLSDVRGMLDLLCRFLASPPPSDLQAAPASAKQ